MICLHICLLCVTVFSSCYGVSDFKVFGGNSTFVSFTDFVKLHKKQYASIGKSLEYKIRKKIFTENYLKSRTYNKLRTHNSSAWFGVTKFSDLTQEEFLSQVLHHNTTRQDLSKRPRLKGSSGSIKTSNVDLLQLSSLPQKIDWRKNGTVTSVKYQGSCGACWAFSTVETIESMFAIARGTLSELSVQQVIDCTQGGARGCRGGDICLTLDWMVTSGVHIVPERIYPLTLKDQKCKMEKPTKGIQVEQAVCSDFRNREEKLIWYLATHGPVTVAADATSWQNYLGGIIHFHCEHYTNHAVQIVGYDLTGDIPYYIVRNTWGKDFGIGGYLHIAVGSNMCGLASEVAVITVR